MTSHKTPNRALWGRRNTVQNGTGNVYNADGDFIGQVVWYRDGWHAGRFGTYRTRREAISAIRQGSENA